jgi:hypothetical protein
MRLAVPISRLGPVARAGTLPAMGTLLTRRRAVDLCRVGSCLCRMS